MQELNNNRKMSQMVLPCDEKGRKHGGIPRERRRGRPDIAHTVERLMLERRDDCWAERRKKTITCNGDQR